MSEQLKQFAMQLLEETKAGDITWEPMTRFIQGFGFSEIVEQMLFSNEFRQVVHGSEFLCRSNDVIAAILRERAESGMTGEIREKIYLYLFRYDSPFFYEVRVEQALLKEIESAAVDAVDKGFRSVDEDEQAEALAKQFMGGIHPVG